MSKTKTLALSLGDLERLLATLHGAVDARRPALRARLKHLQRLGFPDGINTGTGKHARYRVAALVHVLVLFELLQAGLSPERAIAIIRETGTMLPSIGALGTVGSGRSSARPADRQTDDVFAIVSPEALIDLTREYGAEPTAPGRLRFLPLHLLGDLGKSVDVGRRALLINMTELLRHADHALVQMGVTVPGQLDAELQGWEQDELYRDELV